MENTAAAGAQPSAKSPEQEDYDRFCDTFARWLLRANRLGYAPDLVRQALINQLESERAVMISVGVPAQLIDERDEKVRNKVREGLPKLLEELKAKASLPAPPKA